MSPSKSTGSPVEKDLSAESSPLENEEVLKFSPEEEAKLLEESNEEKLEANKLFGSSEFTQAIESYEAALESCPNYLDFEVAVLQSNIAACYLKLQDWKAAILAATAAIECLERYMPQSKEKDPSDSQKVEEVSEEDTAKAPLSPMTEPKHSKEDVQRIRAKALMRRAKARTESGGWSALQGAEEDYKLLSSMPSLPFADMKIVRTQLSRLPSRIEEAKAKEMGEMMGKLKNLGNGILKPFGLSTDNFNMVKDEASGGYSMNFNQSGKS